MTGFIFLCGLNISSGVSFQINIPADLLQRTLRAVQRYVSGKDVNPAVYDEAQYQVFKELLPFWAGFMKKYEAPEEEKRPCKDATQASY